MDNKTKVEVEWMDGRKDIFFCDSTSSYNHDETLLYLDVGNGKAITIPLFNVRMITEIE